MSQGPSYRADIDGLRAVAVLCVILFHYGLAGMPGGFAGVDIFFVISGYLITAQLSADLSRHGLGLPTLLTNFYGRRIRRIMPALLAMLAATCMAGWFAIIPQDYAGLGASAAFSALGLGNLYFALHTGYFDRAAEFQPLVHLWSLGVEEQFYLFWPGLLFFLFRVTGSRKSLVAACLATLVLASFAASHYVAALHPHAAFYLSVFRGWELGAGALIAFCPAVTRRWPSELMGVIGLVLVGYAVFALEGAETSLSFDMLAAVVGSALLIYPRERSFVAHGLAAEPMRRLGLISYSLYLWHWPILVFYRLAHVETRPTLAACAVLLLGTLALSVASYLLVEQPMRRWPLRRAVWSTLAGVVAIVALGVVLKLSGGVPSRLPEFAARIADGANDFSQRRPQCHRTDRFDPPIERSCLYGDPRATPSVAVWGDSHAVEIGHALGEIAESRHLSVMGLTYSSCPPIQNSSSPFSTGCRAFNRNALNHVIRSPSIRTVVLAAYFEYYLNEPIAPAFRTGLEQTVAALTAAGKRVIVVASNPETGYSIPQQATRLAVTSSAPAIDLPIEAHRRTSAEARDMLDRLVATYPSLKIVDPAQTLCDRRICPMIVGSHTVLFDADHLTMFAARKVAKSAAASVFTNTR